jgi:hypothetical protein
MSRISRKLPLLVGAALLLLWVSPLSAYVIILKDGTRLIAKEKPTVQGDRLVFITKIGVSQSLPAKDYDQKATEDANKLISGGDAYVLNTPDGRMAITKMDTRKPTLSEYIKKHNETNLVLKDQKAPSAPRSAGEKAGAEKAPAASDAPALDPMTNDTFLRALESSGIRGPRLSGLPHAVRVQAVADSEQQVFAALGAIARGLKETRAAGRSLDKAEIWLLTSNGQSAGRFDMSPDDADALLNGKIGAAKYFVANVIF